MRIRCAWFVRGMMPALVVSLALAPRATAQAAAGTTVSGRLVHTLTQQPVAGVTVLIEELRLTTRSGPAGEYLFENVPPGEYHLAVRAEGFGSRRTEVTVGTDPVRLDLPVDPELHYTEVVSVSPGARSAFEAYQPTSVLAGQDLAKQLQGSLGATLANQPGVAERSLGPAPARPVIRGLDGDRVLILEDGQRTGDLSSQSGDHGVTINPAAASRIEVVRGPATLLYGANAIGGLVNVITERIPTSPVEGVEGSATLEAGSGGREGGAAGDIWWGEGPWVFHASGSGRRTGDVRTPIGPIENSHSRAGEGSVGASWVGERAYVGASYGYDDTKYGVPVLEGGEIQLDTRRHQFSVRSGGQGFGGLFDSYRATLGHRRYGHDELEGAEIGTRFRNNTTELELLAGHRPFARFGGTVGAWALDRRFEAVGPEALSPPVDQQGLAAFLYEEVKWPHFTVQFGGRLEHARFTPDTRLPPRRFTTASGSLGVLYRPAFAHDAITFAASLARAARNPALEELYFFGAHAGNFSFEIGNPDLGPETGIGFDGSFRWQTRRLSGEVTYFRNDIRNYIFRQPISEEEFDERFGHDEHEEGEDGHDHGVEFPFIEFRAADALLQGVEAHADAQLTRRIFAELGFDYVRGTLSEKDDPLPRMPPLRGRFGLRYQHAGLQAGAELTAIARQDRVFGAETATGGATLLKLFAAYSFEAAGAVNTITARVDNLTNELWYNHLSLIKEFVPEMGRSVRVIYSVRFQ